MFKKITHFVKIYSFVQKVGARAIYETHHVVYTWPVCMLVEEERLAWALVYELLVCFVVYVYLRYVSAGKRKGGGKGGCDGGVGVAVVLCVHLTVALLRCWR
jgi:hypothetical protein